jgi:pyridinium-3,5-biscarboxylic acid mononucleotide sulfurtransferase
MINDLNSELAAKWEKLLEILTSYQQVVVAFSGGVDSGLLCVASHLALGEKMLALTVDSPINNPEDVKIAEEVAKKFGFPHQVVKYNDLDNPMFTANPPDRCYHCKLARFKTVLETAKTKGIDHILEGSNADDSHDYRPGKRAVLELGVHSPLLEVGLKKQEIREISFKLGMPIWDRPSAPCLGTRFPYGTSIHLEDITKIALGEKYLREKGFHQVRVRYMEHGARIEVLPGEIARIVSIRDEILPYFKQIGFVYVLVDLAGYRTGSMNEVL